MAALAAACGSPVETTPLTGETSFVVSNSVTIGSAGSHVVQGSYLSHPVAFVSLVPGTLPGVTAVRILVHRNGVIVPAAVVDGGLDPVAVPAIAGDTLTITAVEPDGSESNFVILVPLRKPPVIIRTEPKKNKRDVAVNVRIQVVFSEPIDAASLIPPDFVLRSGSTQVTGQLGFGNPEHTIVEFTPAADLAAATDYELVLGPGIRDIDGAPLEAGTSISFLTAVPQPGSLGYGSLTGMVRGNGSGYPANGNGMPPRQGADQWPVFIAISSPGQAARYAWTAATGTFEFTGLAAGEWTLLFTGGVPWSWVFPGLRLFADTLVKATVLPNQTTIIPEMVPNTVAPFIIIAVERCPWGFSAPPTYQDWGNCDSGYWGGVDAAVEVRGIAGTATAGLSYSRSISSDRWHVELHEMPLGEYEVSVVPVSSIWRLLPWQSPTVRLRVDRGLAYAEFDYWYEK